jgi:bifunctional isochorismate lyase/aryl carrier protein
MRGHLMPKRGIIKKAECALLIIDMQKYFCDPLSDACVPDINPLLRNIIKLQTAFQSCQRPVFFTRHIDDKEKHSRMFEWWSENILADDPRSALSDEFNVSGCLILDKNQYDAFLHTDLEARLRDQKITQVVICGVLTNLCCESTARSAFMRGFHVFFVDDATRTYTHDMHKATLLNLSYGFATISNTQDVLKTLQKK